MRRRKSSSNDRAAFTLMELMLVMAILVIMAGMVTIAYNRIAGNAEYDLCETEIKTIEKACMSYRLKHRRFPNQLDDLTTVPAGLSQRKWGGPYLEKPPIDPWGNQYSFTYDQDNDRVVVISPGPDGAINTADDVPDPAG
jgi:general secretion pathway protein G